MKNSFSKDGMFVWDAEMGALCSSANVVHIIHMIWHQGKDDKNNNAFDGYNKYQRDRAIDQTLRN